MKIGNIIFVVLALCAQAYADGGGIVGSGQPGLILSPKDMGPLDDVIINPPDNEYGTVLISGEVGENQRSDLMIQSCKDTNSKYKIQLGSCFMGHLTYARTGEVVRLKAGVYWIYLGSQKARVEVKAGENLEIKLRRIILPKGRSNFSARVFFDYDSPEMQKIFMTKIMETNHGNAFCLIDDSDNCRLFNDAVVTGNLTKLMGPYFQFRKQRGYFATDDQGKEWTGWGRAQDPVLYLSEKIEAGAFAGVFPGVYGIEFTDERGNVTYEYGKVVQ